MHHDSTFAADPAPLKRRSLLAAAAWAPWLGAASANAEETWPSRAVTIVSPYNPGGTNDTVARLVADRLQKALGQPFVVENRGGAAGVIGAQSVMRAKPDGYTLLAGNNGGLVIQSAGRQPSPYDPLRQLTPIMKVADAMQFITVSADLPVKSVAELVAYAKKNPGKLNFSSAGAGSFGHFLTEYLMVQTGIEMVHVPAKGSAAALTELMAQRVQVLIDPLVLSQASDSRIRILASISAQRLEAYPQFPSIKESGGPDLELVGWFGLEGPAGLPQAVVDRVLAVGRTLMQDTEMRKTFISAGLTPAFAEGRAFADLIRHDLKRVADIRTRANIKLD